MLAMSLSTAHAFPIAQAGTEGLSVIVSNTDHVIATYQGNSASFSNDLLLNGQFIFNNQASPVGTTVDLGSFAIGTELVFTLLVNNTRDKFFTGPAARNPDALAHARVEANWEPGVTLVSFEDLNGGPLDYNDLSFSFTNTVAASVPEPSSVAMILAAGGLLLRRKKASAQQ